jgi:ligand-binding sensor domain-containing protein
MSIDNNNIIWTGCISYYGSQGNTIGGIMSFDGTSWTKFDTSNSAISDVNISSVFADKSNTIWIGGSSTGLVDQKNGSDWIQHNPSKAEIEDGFIRDFVFDKNEFAYINAGKGLVKFNWKTWTRIRSYRYDQNPVLVNDNSRIIFEKSDTMLNVFDGTNWTLIPEAPFPGYRAPDDFRAIAIDTAGGIWMDCLGYVTYEWIDNPNPIYIPVFHEGLAYYDGNLWTVYEHLEDLIPGTSISGIHEIKVDRNNTIWFGTDKGLLKFDGINWQLYNASNSLIPYDYINHLAIDTLNNVWLSDEHYGLLKFDGTNWALYPHPTLNPYIAWGELEIDMDGSVWQTTLFDVIRFDGTNWSTYNSNNSPIPANSNITALSVDKLGNKWIGTQFGFLVYRKEGVKIPLIPGGPVSDSRVTIFPNPFHESFEMRLSKEFSKVELSIFDMRSRLIYTVMHDNTDRIVVNRHNFASGVYSYRLKSNNSIISTGKLVAK